MARIDTRMTGPIAGRLAGRIQSAMLMTAGMGTRLRPFTDLKTKALLPVFGIPVAQYCVDSLAAAGVKTIVANVHHLSEQTQMGLRALEWSDVELKISDETECLLGSAGGIRKAAPLLGTRPFFLANADVISDINWQVLAERHFQLRDQLGVVMTLAVFPSSAHGGAYREIQLDSHHTKVVGLGDVKPGVPFFVGAAVLEPEALSQVPAQGPAEFVPTVLEPALRSGRVGAYYSHGIWYDIGSPSLWRRTHFSLMDQLEADHFSSPGSKLWQRRIHQNNRRVARQFWVSSESPAPQFSWEPPCYWSAFSESSKDRLRDHESKDFKLGPYSVLYGALDLSLPRPQSLSLSHGIGYGGIWINC